LNVNALNNDGFSVLDLAVLVNNRAIIKLLLQYGVQTGSFPKENIETHLNGLLADAEKKLSQCVTNAGTSSTTTTTAGQGMVTHDNERQKLAIEKRIKLIRKMINGWQRLKVPDPPFSFTIGNVFSFIIIAQPCALASDTLNNNNLILVSIDTDVIGGNSVLLKILEPIVEETICTTFRGEHHHHEATFEQTT
jgi:ankyrin repeat protein